MRSIRLPLLFILFVAGLCAQNSEAEIRPSIVRVFSTMQEAEYFHPWKWSEPREKSGQGLVVAEDTVLTLATIVSRARQIEIRFEREPVATPAKVIHLDLERNLALLKADLPEGAKAFDIPDKSVFEARKEVRVYWKTGNGRFLDGSANLDRVESFAPAESQQVQLFLIANQSSVKCGFATPVFCDGQLIGLADNWGNDDEFAIIPVESIQRSIGPKSAMAGFVHYPLTQQHLRNRAGLGGRDGGCYIAEVFEQGSGSRSLKNRDILLSVNGYELDPWGHYEDPHFGTLGMYQIFSALDVGGTLPVTLLRDGKVMELELELSVLNDREWLIPRMNDGRPSDYLIRGGFIFVPLTEAYLQSWGANWQQKAPDNLLHIWEQNRYKCIGKEKKEIVVLSSVLAHPSNRGLQDFSATVVSGLNGKALNSLQQLKMAIDSPEEDIIRLELDPGNDPLWLSPTTLRQADPDIRQRYSIPELERFNHLSEKKENKSHGNH